MKYLNKNSEERNITYELKHITYEILKHLTAGMVVERKPCVVLPIYLPTTAGVPKAIKIVMKVGEAISYQLLILWNYHTVIPI